jgi:hypothetical protein
VKRGLNGRSFANEAPAEVKMQDEYRGHSKKDSTERHNMGGGETT